MYENKILKIFLLKDNIFLKFCFKYSCFQYSWTASVFLYYCTTGEGFNNISFRGLKFLSTEKSDKIADQQLSDFVSTRDGRGGMDSNQEASVLSFVIF